MALKNEQSMAAQHHVRSHRAMRRLPIDFFHKAASLCASQPVLCCKGDYAALATKALLEETSTESSEMGFPMCARKHAEDSAEACCSRKLLRKPCLCKMQMLPETQLLLQSMSTQTVLLGCHMRTFLFGGTEMIRSPEARGRVRGRLRARGSPQLTYFCVILKHPYQNLAVHCAAVIPGAI